MKNLKSGFRFFLAAGFFILAFLFAFRFAAFSILAIFLAFIIAFSAATFLLCFLFILRNALFTVAMDIKTTITKNMNFFIYELF